MKTLGIDNETDNIHCDIHTPAPNKAQHSPLPWEIAKDSERELTDMKTHADKLAEALRWIKEVVSERKGTAHWLQMVEDKTRNALAAYEAAQ